MRLARGCLRRRRLHVARRALARVWEGLRARRAARAERQWWRLIGGVRQRENKRQWTRRLAGAPLSTHLLVRALRWAPAVAARSIAAFRIQRAWLHGSKAARPFCGRRLLEARKKAKAAPPAREAITWRAKRHHYQLVRKWPSSECPEAEKVLEKILERLLERLPREPPGPSFPRLTARQRQILDIATGRAGQLLPLFHRIFAYLRQEEPMFRMYHPWPAPVFVNEICAERPRHVWAHLPVWVVCVDVIPGSKNGAEKQTRWMVFPLIWSDIVKFLVRWALNDYTTENMILREDSLDPRFKSTYDVKSVFPPPIMRPAWSAAVAAQRRNELNNAISSQTLEGLWTELMHKAGITRTHKPFRAMVNQSRAIQRQKALEKMPEKARKMTKKMTKKKTKQKQKQKQKQKRG